MRRHGNTRGHKGGLCQRRDVGWSLLVLAVYAGVHGTQRVLSSEAVYPELDVYAMAVRAGGMAGLVVSVLIVGHVVLLSIQRRMRGRVSHAYADVDNRSETLHVLDNVFDGAGVGEGDAIDDVEFALGGDSDHDHDGTAVTHGRTARVKLAAVDNGEEGKGSA